MNKKVIVAISIFAGISILLISLFIENNKREAITINSYASEIEISLDDLIKKADLIVMGDFLNVYPSRWSTANGKLPDNATIEFVSRQRLSIFTDSTFKVTQYLKGASRSPIVRIRTFGGQVGDDSMIVSGEPVYKIGQTYFLFLYYNTGATANINSGSYYGSSILYEIKDSKAISADDEWNLDELIAYIQNKLLEADSTATSTVIPIDTSTDAQPTATFTPSEVIQETVTPSP